MKISEDVYSLESSKRSHIYLIRSDMNILIDTGMPGLMGQIVTELQSLATPSESIQAILLTHHDIDHIGNAKSLQNICKAGLWAPKEDIEFIVGKRNRPGIKRIIQLIIRPEIPDVSGYFSTDNDFGEVKAIHAPGHTPGHTIFQYRNMIFTGDLFKVIEGQFKLLPNYMNWNPNELKKSIALLKSLDFEWICPSHGSPIQNGPIVNNFLSQF